MTPTTLAALPAVTVTAPDDPTLEEIVVVLSGWIDRLIRERVDLRQKLAALEPAALAPTDAAQAPAEDAHVKGETAGQMLERLGMDGAKWAAEFRTTALRLGYSDMDEGWLIGWFCNAIMAGYDRSAAQAREAALLEAWNVVWEAKTLLDAKNALHALIGEART